MGAASVGGRPVGARSSTAAARLARLGFADPAKAATLLSTPLLAGFLDPMDEVFADGLAEALAESADPDQALLALVRVVESLDRADLDRAATSTAGLLAALRVPGTGRRRLLAVLGSSAALGDHLVRHPEHWVAATTATDLDVEDRRAAMCAAVRDLPYADALDALRVEYRRQLIGVAAIDLTAADPLDRMPATAAALADLAEAALEGGLLIARQEYGPGHERCRLAVIAMGKTGGRELNYVSDVDVIFVAEPASGVAEDEAMAIGHVLATGVMKACSQATSEGTLWPVDAALRPEGKQGQLVRTVASHVAYYERWAKTWEFQALLKARCVAGDMDLGTAYHAAISPMVWEAAGRENFVEDVQAMRRRVEKHIPAAEAQRQLKLGKGGLRDVEFSVQLMQLVHGRSDPSLRSPTTLEALAALGAGGYLAREDAATLDTAYRMLRSLEHRIQLFRLRRTHLMPTSPPDLRRLGRALGYPRDSAAEIVKAWQAQAREVRRIHEKLFYRPLLAAVARLSRDEHGLTTAAARDRLKALGFGDPAGAMRHLESLVTGMSRRAAIQRHLLPVMLGWFADEADPDAGLLSFRRVSDELGSTHWYLKMLRDEGRAAELLAHSLGRSRYAADLLIRSPESVAVLGDPAGLKPRSAAALIATMTAAAGRQDDPDQAMAAAREIRAAELARITFAVLAGELDQRGLGNALSDLTQALVQVALALAIARIGGTEPVPVDMAVIAMGSFGGREMGFGSDADVMFVHRPNREVSEADAQAVAVRIVQELVRLLGGAGPDPGLALDADLRPEGKNGPLVRSLEAYAAYYERWALTWEFQALLRARPVAGDERLGADFVDLVNPLRYPPNGIDPKAVLEIRRMKARVESERLPRGAEPRLHLKLGPGGMTDVEWTAQLLQLRYAGADPALRVTGTVEALEAAVAGGFLAAESAAILIDAWSLATSIRSANLLWRGRPSDQVPSAVRDGDGVGRIIGRPPGSGTALVEQWMSTGRHARPVVRAEFYDS